jgi:hypothetical protein
MTDRRNALKMMAGSAIAVMAQPLAAATSGKVRVTLVRWPYT